MIFEIETFNKDLDIYTVVAKTGEKKVVSAAQIVMVMLKGVKFTNAKLTGKGFAILTSKGTRYIQVNGLPKQVLAQMHTMAAQEQTAKKNNVTSTPSGHQQHNKQEATVSGQVQIKNAMIKRAPSAGSGSYVSGTPVTVGGVTYKSTREMCTKHNRDFQVYSEMLKKGYTKEEALGIVDARPIDVVAKERLKTSHALDRMAYDRGEM